MCKNTDAARPTTDDARSRAVIGNAERRVRILGGGPGGLFAARLLALDHPSWKIALSERLPPGHTFGFGVGLTSALLDSLAEADPDVHADVQEAAFGFAGAEFRLPAGRVALGGRWHSGAIGRARLLEILTARAVEAGVQMRLEHATIGQLRGDADLVIAADGVSSATRESLAGELGARERIGRGVFIWCGSRTPLQGTVFHPVETAAGMFVAHAYPYDDGLSTFVIETDEETLARAGCFTTEFADDGDSDVSSLEYLSDAFNELIGGGEFIGNRSRWMHFRTITCERWSTGNSLLLGDARATVHPSIGSGTKVALEDAIVLRDVLHSVDETDDLPDRMAEFERLRRPAIERLQERALRSQLWWESFPTRLHLSPARVAVAYLSRAGAVSLDDALESAPELARQAAADWAGVDCADVPRSRLSEWITERAAQAAANGARPEHASALRVECADPWSADADALIARAGAVTSGSGSIELRGGHSRSEVLDRLALGERIRTQLGLTVTTWVDRENLDDAAAGVVAGRTDYVRVDDEAGSSGSTRSR